MTEPTSAALQPGRVSFDQLKQFITLAMTRLGLPEDDACAVGRLMAEAECRARMVTG